MKYLAMMICGLITIPAFAADLSDEKYDSVTTVAAGEKAFFKNGSHRLFCLTDDGAVLASATIAVPSDQHIEVLCVRYVGLFGLYVQTEFSVTERSSTNTNTVSSATSGR